MTEDINETKSIRAVYIRHCMQGFKKAENNFKEFRSRRIGGSCGQTQAMSWANSTDGC